MIQENTTNTRINKSISRKRYAERQFGKWVKWSIAQKGCVLFKEVIEKQIEYKVVLLPTKTDMNSAQRKPQ